MITATNYLEKSPIMSLCPACGNENRPAARYCCFCGNMLATPSPSTLPSEEQQDQAVEATPHPIMDNSEELTVILDVAPPEPEQSLPDPEVPTQAVTKPATDHSLWNKRYRLLRQTSQPDDPPPYEAEDTLRCPDCLALQDQPAPQFCQQCGLELNRWPIVRLYEIPEPPPPETTGEWFSENGKFYRVELVENISGQPPAPPIIHIQHGYQSNTGMVRESNEDSVLCIQMTGLSQVGAAPALGLFAVADGIGGQAAGEIASHSALRALAASSLENIFLPVAVGQESAPETLESALQQAVFQANQTLLNLHQQPGLDTNLGCTLSTAVIYGTTAIIAHVGDSRVYHLHQGQIRLVTRDHSVAALLLEKGSITPEELYLHEQKGVIYRSLGDKSALEVDTYRIDLQPGDRLLLCSDGLWEMVRDPMLEEALLQYFDPQQACNRLVAQANLAGGDDNISVIIVNIQDLNRS